jgi:hypothetical protein
MMAIPVPFLLITAIMYDGFFSKLEAIAGGGPIPLDYGFPKNSEPWKFNFDIGEGYAAGPARLRPAPGAPDLSHH